MHEQAILIRLLDFNMSKKFKIGYSKSIEGDKLIGALATNTSVDRDGDIMETSGIDLGNFMKNPVMLWAHDHMSLPIGRIINTRKTAEGLVFDAEFSKSNPFAQKVKALFEEKILNAFSIGFMIKNRKNEVITDSELVEISAVNVPANPEALLSRSYNDFQKSLKELELKEFKDETKKIVDSVSEKFTKQVDDVKNNIIKSKKDDEKPKEMTDIEKRMDAIEERIDEMQSMMKEMMDKKKSISKKELKSKGRENEYQGDSRKIQIIKLIKSISK